jgi:hypothetical protein
METAHMRPLILATIAALAVAMPAHAKSTMFQPIKVDPNLWCRVAGSHDPQADFRHCALKEANRATLLLGLWYRLSEAERANCQRRASITPYSPLTILYQCAAIHGALTPTKPKRRPWWKRLKIAG